MTTLDSLHEALNNWVKAEINNIINGLHPSEIADVLESLPTKQRAKLWQLKSVKPEDILPHIK